jgi:uncharacterized membrane protein YgcG
MKKVISITIVALLMLSALSPILVHAQTTNEHGNEWVYDEPQVLSAETEAYIKNLNENVFDAYVNKPQLAIMIINDLPYDMEQYKLDTFNDYGVGTKNENCGMLFIFAINDREYGLEIGDGFTKGSMLRADLETDFVTEEIKTYLRSENYNSAVMMIVQHLETMMSNQENGVYAQKEAEKMASDKRAANMVIAKIHRIGTVTLASESKIKEARSAYSSLTSAQQKLVDTTSLEAAEEQLAELKNAKLKESLKSFMILLGIACPIIGMVFFCVVIIRKMAIRNKINSLCNKHAKCIDIADLSNDAIQEEIRSKYSGYNPRALEEEFVNILYQMYIKQQTMLIQSLQSHMLCGYTEYIDELKRVNNKMTFERHQLVPLPIIVSNVNEKQRQKNLLRAANTQSVRDFINENRYRVDDAAILNKVDKAMHQHFDNFATNVTPSQMERYFVEQLDHFGFEKEFDKFLNENQDKIGSDFSRNTLYNEMCVSNYYRNYHYGCRIDRVWMMHMLMHHQNTQKQKRLDQERREQEAAERRRREAQRRAQQQSVSRMNSSFGGGFGGGRSSGGGMRGGW